MLSFLFSIREGTELRGVWIIAGWSSFSLGVVGAFLPLLPTVPFMLLAAFCFTRGSERFHDWLLAHPRFGLAIRDWRREGAISRTGKRAALIAIVLSMAIALAAGFPVWMLAAQAIVLAAVSVFILTRPHPTHVPDD